MKLIKTKIPDLLILKTKVFTDKRGFLKETFRKDILNKTFPFDILSYSKKNVLRGLHFQSKYSQAKLITVTHGKILDVAVDLRKRSKTFGKYFSIVLSDKNGKSLFIPEGFAHGFLTLDKENIVYYFNTKYRSIGNEVGLNWKDKDLNIKWPIKKPILSQKDKNNMTFMEFKKKYIKKN